MDLTKSCSCLAVKPRFETRSSLKDWNDGAVSNQWCWRNTHGTPGRGRWGWGGKVAYWGVSNPATPELQWATKQSLGEWDGVRKGVRGSAWG